MKKILLLFLLVGSIGFSNCLPTVENAMKTIIGTFKDYGFTSAKYKFAGQITNEPSFYVYELDVKYGKQSLKKWLLFDVEHGNVYSSDNADFRNYTILETGVLGIRCKVK